MNTRMRFALAGMVSRPYAALRGLCAWHLRPRLLVWELDRLVWLREYLTGAGKVACDEWEAGDAQRPSKDFLGEGAGG